MATINQLNKQIETANRRLNDYETKAQKYAAQAVKNLAKLNAKTGNNYTLENYKEYDCKTDNWAYFEDYCRVSNAVDYQVRNEKHARIERRDIERKQVELKALIQHELENANCNLENALNGAMVEFRKVWEKRMQDYFSNRFDVLRSKLDGATKRYAKAEKCYSYFLRRAGWRKTRLVMWLENQKQAAAKVMNDEANRMSKPAYMAKMADDMRKVWNAGITKLAAKCRKFGLNEAAITAHYPNVVEKGFEVLLKDDANRTINARVIWAAEYSVLVQPHTRYIVTEIKNK